VKRDNLAAPTQRHVIAPFILYLQFSNVFILNISNKRVISDFMVKCTKIVSSLLLIAALVYFIL